jgi:hypothetical protein
MEPEKVQRHPSTTGLLRWFSYEHLPTDLGVVSMQFHHLAHELADRLPDSPELTVALRKLLEGKDAAVRAALELREQQATDRSAAEQSAAPVMTAGPEWTTPEGAAVARRLGQAIVEPAPAPGDPGPAARAVARDPRA